MKKNYLSLLILVSFSCFSQSTIPNADFENWQNIGSNSEEPTNWNSVKTGGGFSNLGPQVCFRESNNPYTGNYCLKLETKSYFGTPISGMGTTGKIQNPTTNSNDNYVETTTTDANFNSPFTGKPTDISGYYKFTSAGTSSGKFTVILHGNYNVRNPADANSTPYIIAKAEFTIPNTTVSDWTSFSVPFTYFSSDTPSYILIIAESGSATGNILWLDNLDVTYALSNDTFQNENQTIITYPNPTKGQVNLNLEDLKDVTVNVYDVTGKLLFSDTKINQPNYSFDLKQTSGQYLIEVQSENKKKFAKVIKL